MVPNRTMYTVPLNRLPGGLRKASCSFHAALEPNNLPQQESLEKFVKIIEQFARDKVTVVN